MIEDAWAQLERRRAWVKRVTGRLVSVTVEGFHEPTTFRVPDELSVELLSTSRELVVAGGRGPNGSFKVGVFEVGPGRFWADRAWTEQHLAPVPTPPSRPASPPAYVPVLVEHGLLPAGISIAARHWTLDALGLLRAVYAPREAITRGFVHYAKRWRSDTADVIADFGEMLGQQDALRALAGKRGEIAFSVREASGEVVRLCEDNLSDAAARIDDWLARIGADVRLFDWATGSDDYAFLARGHDVGLALARALDVRELTPAAAAFSTTAADDPDFF